VTTYLIEHSPQARSDPFMERLVTAAFEVRAMQPVTARSAHGPAESLSAAGLRVLELLPTCTYLEMAGILHISRNTVKTHIRSIYQKLGVASRSQAIQRAVHLRLL
jgi:LuxR family transcriptional regulator, maltose regulon positive regulatory protein